MRTFFIAVSTLLATAYPSKGQIVIHYDNDKSESVQLNEKLVIQIQDSINTLQPQKVVIHGYTDSVGTYNYNQTLSEKRAKIVQEELLRLNTKVEIIAIGHSENDPVSSSLAESRRVEICFIGPQVNISDSELSSQELENLLAEMAPKEQLAYIDPTRDTLVHFNDHEIEIHIPRTAFVYKNGTTVDKKVTLSFKNYKSSADVVFSGIPMTTKDGRMNSSGMFDIRGYEGGKQIDIAPSKGLLINYNMTQQIANTNFYFLDPSKKEWIEKQKITNENAEFLNQAFGGGGGVGNFEDMEIRKRKGFWPFNRFSFRTGRMRLPVRMKNGTNGGQMLASGMNAGHTYPKQVQGLSCKAFGVYNCDQIYRLGTTVTINATYKTPDNVILNNVNVLSMVDHKYQGAFSFHPSSITFNPLHENTLLLFTKSGKIYGLHKNNFPKVDKETHEYTFEVTEITQKANTSEKLKSYLAL